jgi:hypothetical protein
MARIDRRESASIRDISDSQYAREAAEHVRDTVALQQRVGFRAQPTILLVERVVITHAAARVRR